MAEYLKFNSPIYNLQVFLRFIANEYDDIPSVIPDGVYGNGTKDAVLAFQNKFSLNESGEVDNSTWDKIVDVYLELDSDNNRPYTHGIYPENGLREDYLSYVPTVYMVQTMLSILSKRFDNIPEPTVNGVIDYSTIESINAMKIVFGLNPDGNIDKVFLDYLSIIYDIFIVSDRVDAFISIA